MTIEIRQLRQVLALAEHGSFSRASLALHLSQPALSRSIQNLEKQLRTPLFVRANDGVSPTDMGRVLIQRARDLVRLAAELDREMLDNSSLESGHVIVGAGPFPAEGMLGVALARLVNEFPSVSVSLRIRNWDQLLRRLRSRDLDFFVAEISTLEHENDIELEAPFEHQIFFVTRSGHPLAAAAGFEPKDIFGWPFVAPGRIPPRVLEQLLSARRDSHHEYASARAFPSIECTGLSAVKRILGDSDAVTALTLPCIAQELESGQFTVLGTAPWLHSRYGIVSLKGRVMTRAAEKLREFVIEAESAVTSAEQRLIRRWLPSSHAPTAPPPDADNGSRA